MQREVRYLNLKYTFLIIAGYLLLSGCAPNKLQFLHGVTENRQTLKIQARPDPMQIYLDGEFLGITPLTTDLWFRDKKKLVLSAKGMGSDTTFHSVDLRFEATPKIITFYSGSVSDAIPTPAIELLKIPEISSAEEMPDSLPVQNLPDCSMPVIHFDFNDSVLSLTGKEQLLSVSALLKDDPIYHLEIHGYADERGSESYNRKLSLKRAKSVYRQLVNQGIDERRLAVFGHGEITTLQYDGSELEYGDSRVVHFRLFTSDQDEPH